MLKTSPRKRSILKLLDAVAHGGNPQDRAASLFATLASSLFGQALPYSETKKVSNFDAWIFYLYKLFCTEPAISSFQGTFLPLLRTSHAFEETSNDVSLVFRFLGRQKYCTATRNLAL